MQNTKYNAFGYKVGKTELAQGEVITSSRHMDVDNTIIIRRPYNPNFTLNDNVDGGSLNNIWLVVKGKSTFTNVYNGDSFVWEEGYCSLDTPMPVGFWTGNTDEDLAVFAFTPSYNLDKTPIMPNVSTFKMLAGNTMVTSSETKLFLAEGELSINGTAVTGTKQVLISSGKTVTATTNSYGFIFN